MISTAFRCHFHKLMEKVSVRLDFHAGDQSSVRIVDHEPRSSFRYGFALTITSVRPYGFLSVRVSISTTKADILVKL